MKKEDILARLRQNEAALKGQGVSHAALFGSRACGEDNTDSDIDIMVEIAPDARMDLLQYVGTVQYIEELFPVPVDVSNREGLKAVARPRVERDAIYAF